MDKTCQPSTSLLSRRLQIVVSFGVLLFTLILILLFTQGSRAGKVDQIAALIEASKETPASDMPPLPSKNPLRTLRQKDGDFRYNVSYGSIPPETSRGGLMSNRLKSLAPVLNLSVSSADIAALKNTINHTIRNRLVEARASRSQIVDPAVRKLAWWYYLRKASSLDDPMAMERFRKKNTDWPSRGLLRRRVERALLKNDASPSTIKGLYAKKRPTSGTGKFLLALAYKRTGQPQKALKLVREAWHRHTLGKKTEKKLLSIFGNQLGAADHRRRADHFLYKDKKRHLPAVRRVKKYLSKPEQEKINLRMEVIKRRLKDAEKQYAKLGKDALSDVGLLFNKIQLLRRKEKFEASRQLLARAPLGTKAMVEPNEWWIERRLQTRYALRQNKPLAAYKIASNHGKISRRNLCDAEFLSGWIALTRLNKIELAAGHFVLQRKHARRRREISKAEYWLGRLAQKRGDKIGALSHFSNSAKYFRTYYGQLALQAMKRKSLVGQLSPPVPSRLDLRRFLARDAVRALVIAHKADQNGLVSLFFNALAWRLKSPGEITLLAELASQIHSRRGSVVTGKIGIYRGFDLDRYAYPLNAMPHYKRLTAKVDTAFILALARQESEFNAKAKSPVGARGMMQIMPGTARQIARQHKVRYSRSRLTSDPSYNISLGVAHLHDLIKKYNGSYILTLVAYNAGPRRVNEWIESFGDPRSSSVDTIDWIESIPFSETRRYVQRIMASVQIFRARLNKQQPKIALLRDINRGHPDTL
ncbi:MAG: lytic transglycosylase domain-containing protein [Hyphomicrobiaceae bacterium]|nr:lytic transglycosylase domain-containing protein [Hyphomicrobiaceae bacterium]